MDVFQRIIPVLSVFCLGLFGTALSPAVRADWLFGEHTLMIDELRTNNHLTIPASGADGLKNYFYLSRVGGVNFELTADIENLMAPEAMRVHYDSESANGQRLTFWVGEHAIPISLPDWMIIPIAKFADSPHTSALTLFGQGEDNRQFYYVDYHAAFENTLLGLRLLQASLLLADPASFRHLPTFEEKIVVGVGEDPEFDASTSALAAFRLFNLTNKYDFQSWLLTDINASSRIDVHHDELVFNTSPYYYFWDIDPQSIQYAQSMQRSYQQLVQQYDTLWRVGEQKKASAIVKAIKKHELDLVTYQPTVKPVNGLIKQLKRQEGWLTQLNPNVWRSVQNTSRYAALFRALKQRSPENWSDFMRQIDKAPLAFVQTPNSLKKPL